MQGHIHKRVHTCEDGRQTTRWHVVLDVEPRPDGRRRQKWHGGFRTRRQAEVVRARLINDLHNHRYVMPARLTVAEWVRQSWLPMIQIRVKATTFGSYRQVTAHHVQPVIGDCMAYVIRTRRWHFKPASPYPSSASDSGHHSPAFTLSQYAHAVPGMQAAAAAAVAELIANAAGAVTKPAARMELLGLGQPDGRLTAASTTVCGGRGTTVRPGPPLWPATH